MVKNTDKQFRPVPWAFALVILLLCGAASYRILISCEPSSFELLQKLKVNLGGCQEVSDVTGGTIAKSSCQPSDQGYDWSRALVRLAKRGNFAFCRVVGDAPTWRIRCTKVSDDGSCAGSFESPAIADMGYERSQSWEDKNGDGSIDFCRTVGDRPFEFKRCVLGPDFTKDVDFK